MTYPQALAYLESFINYEKLPSWPYKESLKLERFRGFLDTIGNPQEALRCIHVAGSKGKGSTCAYIAYILREAGYRTGLYTSPHLVDFRERIRVLERSAAGSAWNMPFEGMISPLDVARILDRLKPAIEAYSRVSFYGPLSFFEVYTALAFVYFRERHCDFVVLETGLGGRLDATNVVESLVAVITPISYEHTQKLGNTLSQIAAEKSGILKRINSALICAPQAREARQVIRRACLREGVPCREVGKDIAYKGDCSAFEVRGIQGRYKRLRIRLLGAHQVQNAACAVAAVEALEPWGFRVGVVAVRKGLYAARWPGRCEIAGRRPLIVLDGAQNVASFKALEAAMRRYFKYRRLIAVFGISRDKDIKGVCRELSGFADTIIVTKARNPRAADPQALARYFKGKNLRVCGSLASAVAGARQIAGRQDLVLICGSLFLVGEYKDAHA